MGTTVFTDMDGLGPCSRVAAEAAARRTLRGQIALLESELAEAFVTAFEMRIGAPATAAAAPGVPRLLDLGELEQVRDQLASRLHDARAQLVAGAAAQARRRELLARMQLEPGRHRFTRIPCRELGEPGCGVWQVRPRLGLVGMLMGWWQVTLSSGCPLARGRCRRRMPTRSGRDEVPPTPRGSMRRVLMTGAGAVLVVAIMVIGSIVLWAGTPLAWLWVGSQIQGATQSIGAALAVAFVGVIATILVLASVLTRLSDLYRANRVARGRGDPGHVVLEGVLVVSAGISLTAFTIWFFLFAGAAPAPIGIQI